MMSEVKEEASDKSEVRKHMKAENVSCKSINQSGDTGWSRARRSHA